MKLFYMSGACSLAPHIVLEWIGKPFELGRIERGKTREPDFLAINPAGKVPALIEEDDRVLTEAEAIWRCTAKNDLSKYWNLSMLKIVDE